MAKFKNLKKGVSGVLVATTVSSSVRNIANSVEFKNGFLGSRMSPGLAREIEGSKSDIRSLKKSLNENKNDTDKKLGNLKDSFNESINELKNNYDGKLNSLENNLEIISNEGLGDLKGELADKISNLEKSFNESINTLKSEHDGHLNDLGSDIYSLSIYGETDDWKLDIKGNLEIYTNKGSTTDATWVKKYASIVRELTTGENVTQIGFENTELSEDYNFYNGLFGDNANLINVDMPNVENIGYSAFTYCYSLIRVNMPKVKNIGDCAFYYCYKLTSVCLPKVRTIENLAFVGCENLKEIDLSGLNSENLINLKIGSGAFSSCSDDLKIIVPAGTTCDKLSDSLKSYNNSSGSKIPVQDKAGNQITSVG